MFAIVKFMSKTNTLQSAMTVLCIAGSTEVCLNLRQNKKKNSQTTTLTFFSTMKDRTPDTNTGFASAGQTCKLEAKCYY